MERYAEPNKKWFDYYVVKIGDADNRHIAIVFQDITELKRREANGTFLAEIA